MELREDVIRRLILAKSLQRYGEAACAERNDRFAFVRGILLLHDAVEAVLGAVADHLNVRLPDRVSFMGYFEKIEEGDDQQRKLPYPKAMSDLNAIRVGIKHHGRFPPVEENRHFPVTVTEFLRTVCRTYFDADYSALSLTSMIQNERVRSHIESAEALVAEGKFEDALVSLGYAMYHLVESKTAGSQLEDLVVRRESPRFRFTRPYGSNFTIELLEHGVDPYTYHRFRNLTPRMVYDSEKQEVLYHPDRIFWHPKNWTESNARFCLDFCIDCALKFEMRPAYDYEIVYYHTVYEDVIEPVGDEAVFWNGHEGGEEEGLLPKGRKREPIFTLKKGEQIVGFAYDHDEEHLDEWTVHSEGIPRSEGWPGGFGYVKKAEVRLTTRERETPAEA